MPKRTPLYGEHLSLGAKMVEFGGWEMPVSYSGIIEEHLAVRNAAGLFDIGHMGVVEISGKDSLPFIQKLATNDASRLSDYHSQYSILLNQNGGVIDDILVYRLPEGFTFILNASNTEKDLAWFKKNLSGAVKIEHRTDVCMLSLQGPKSELILSSFCDINLSPLKRNGCALGLVFGKKCLVSRTGYTGEDGFELFLSAGDVKAAWNGILKEGRPSGLIPCGLGARDSLRIEAALPLYGHEYTEEITPLEAGYGWAVKFDKDSFIGKAALIELKAKGLKRKLCGVVLEGRSIPRHGMAAFADKELSLSAGEITSGTFSPVLSRSIGLLYASTDLAGLGGPLFIDIRGRASAGNVVGLPFYKRAN